VYLFPGLQEGLARKVGEREGRQTILVGVRGERSGG
jgi:hypothetical protein